MTNDNLRLLVDFRREVSLPDEATALRIYRVATTPRVSERRLTPRRRRLFVLSAGAAATLSVAGVLVAVVVSGAAPESAYAAARKAVAATSADAVESGTLTLTSTGPGQDGTSTVSTVRWNGKDFAIAAEGGAQVVPGFVQLLMFGKEALYLQRADGSWLHYANVLDLRSVLDAGGVQAAHELAVGSEAVQLIASSYGLQRAAQPDGSTVYSGTIPPSTPAEGSPGDGPKKFILPGFDSGGVFRLVVGKDGLVDQMSETASPPLTGAWSVVYSQIGSTRPIAPPATYTEGTAGDLPS
jgi:hypothetical protein